MKMWRVLLQIVTTHYVAHTKNPTWEVSSEFIVANFNDVST
jgi:hypothetical protein